MYLFLNNRRPIGNNVIATLQAKERHIACKGDIKGVNIGWGSLSYLEHFLQDSI